MPGLRRPAKQPSREEATARRRPEKTGADKSNQKQAGGAERGRDEPGRAETDRRLTKVGRSSPVKGWQKHSVADGKGERGGTGRAETDRRLAEVGRNSPVKGWQERAGAGEKRTGAGRDKRRRGWTGGDGSERVKDGPGLPGAGSERARRPHHSRSPSPRATRHASVALPTRSFSRMF